MSQSYKKYFYFTCFLPKLSFPLLDVTPLKTEYNMGKKNRKQIREEKEEQQGKKVMITMGVIAIILVILMFIAYSQWG